MDRSYVELIRSSRVTEKTREVLLARASALPPEPHTPIAATPAAFAVLKAVLQRLIPQAEGEGFIDIARELDLRRAAGSGDGWRYADLPPDSLALILGLECIEALAQVRHHSPFTSLGPAEQDALLKQVQTKAFTWPGLEAGKWFEDLLAEATEIYVSHPITLAAIGMSGIAFLPEWPQIGLNTAQAWEPRVEDRDNAPIPDI